MKALLAAAVLLAGLAGPVQAKNFAVPSEDPAITLQIPDDWEITTIDYGFRANEPEDDIIFYVESTKTRNAAALGRLNASWMKEQGIKPLSSQEKDVTYGGLPGRMVRYKATDADGDTNITFVFLPAGTDRFIQFTVWGADEEEQKHEATLSAIFKSIKAIN